MHDALIGDRFVRSAPRAWLDIATAESIVVEADIVEAGELERRQRAGHAIFASRDPALERIVAEIVRAAEVRACAGVQSVRIARPELPTRPVFDAISRALRPLGFVTVHALADVPVPVRRRLWHRHVALIAATLDDPLSIEKTAGWIRDLASVSTRAHLVVFFGSPGGGCGSAGCEGTGCEGDVGQRRRSGEGDPVADMVRESATWARSDSVGSGGRAVRLLVRSESLGRRGRHAAADRWARAAVQAARRRGEVATEETAAVGLVDRLIRAGDWDGAAATGVRELRRVGAWPARRALACATAQALIGAADLPRAEALLQSVSAESDARREAPGAEVRLRFGQLHFWQGRFEEASHDLLAHADASAEFAGWSALNRWACGSLDALQVARRYFREGLLAEAIDFELGRSEASASNAARAPISRIWRRRGAPIERALIAWLRARDPAGREAAGAEPMRRSIRARGAQGIFRWGRGRGAMSLLHDVTTLLQLIHDADEECAALQRSCDWVRHHTSSESAGIVSLRPTRLIAGGGWTDADLREEALQSALESQSARTILDGSQTTCLSPMRYGGLTIGCALVRGDRARSATLGEAALALASACAPALRARLDALSCASAGQSLSTQILGDSPAMLALRDAIARAAVTSFPVLIEGESGTGKELVARALHRLSARRDRTFSPLNCAALTDELAEAELFGHARGAFTGAINARAGLFEETHGGTMFLDEVSELSSRAQAKLLRVLQEREIRRVGEHVARPVDVRVVAATNLPLAEAVARGRFREDLLFRLAVIRIRVPSLRDRIEDVPVLAQAFWRTCVLQTGKRALLGPDALARLCRHRWPGNVRELQNVMAALAVGAPSRGRVAARHVEILLAEAGTAPVVSLTQARETLERQMIAAALARHAGACARAARDLGLSRQGLRKVMKRLGLETHRTRVAATEPDERAEGHPVARTG